VGVAVALAIGGKETGIVALALVPLTLWVTGQPWRVAAVVGALLAAAGLAWYGPDAVVNRELYANQVGALDWFLVQSAAAARLVLLVVLPVGQTPDFDYDAVPFVARVGSVVALGSLGLVAWVCRADRVLIFGLVWMLVALAPRLLVQTPRSYLNEHQFYVPLLGLLVLVAVLCESGRARWA
jgi:hypothetical protein